MVRLLGRRRFWLLLFVTMVLLAFTGHLVGEVGTVAPADHARLTLSTGCLHTGLLLPGAWAVALGLIPHFVLAIASPVLRGYHTPTPLHPPISATSH